MSFSMMTIPNISGARLESLCEFLSAAGLTYEGGAEYTVLLLDDETDAVVGTGSLCGSVLKYIAVSEAMQGEGRGNIVSEPAPCIHMRMATLLSQSRRTNTCSAALAFSALQRPTARFIWKTAEAG
ncbi:MAG: hypothetical protein ACLUZ4_02425 [Christensenellaceae bacterium]